jgi:hypothetical protein
MDIWKPQGFNIVFQDYLLNKLKRDVTVSVDNVRDLVTPKMVLDLDVIREIMMGGSTAMRLIKDMSRFRVRVQNRWMGDTFVWIIFMVDV